MHRSLTSRAPTLGHRNDVGGTLGMSGRVLGAEHEGWILTLLGMTGKDSEREGERPQQRGGVMASCPLLSLEKRGNPTTLEQQSKSRR